MATNATTTTTTAGERNYEEVRLYTQEEYDEAQIRAWWYGFMAARDLDDEDGSEF
jgi:hypothetical protein